MSRVGRALHPHRPSWFTERRELVLLWLGFLAVHWVNWWIASWQGSRPFSDVTVVYRGWVEQGLQTGSIPGIHEPFVYPVGALLPMLATNLIAGGGSYGLPWMLIVTTLNLAALWWLTLRQPESASIRLRRAAAWWWFTFLALLGPIAFGRIDTVTVPIVLIALLEIRGRVRRSGFWLTFSAWLKVWPAAAFAAAFALVRRRWSLVQGALIACAVVLVPVFLLNGFAGLENALSFVTGQTGRGLQVESTAASVFLFADAFGFGDYLVRFDNEILTQQIWGPGVTQVAGLLTVVMFLVVFALLGLAVFWQRRGAGFARLFPALLLGLVTTFIIFNKVGSPQFISWLVPVLMLGLIWDYRRFTPLAVLGLITAALTQLIYPWLYFTVIDAAPVGAVLLLTRNVMLVVMLIVSVRYMRPLRQRPCQ